MKLPITLVLLMFTLGLVKAQNGLPPYLEGKVSYPVFDFAPFAGVIEVEDPELTYNPELDYKVILDIYGRVRDSSMVFPSFVDLARTYNLHVANGVPKEKLHMVAVVHGGSVIAILNDEEYERKYGIPNPNKEAIRQMAEAGIRFYVCGQNMGMFQFRKDQILPQVKVAISAKTTFVTFGQLGYTYLDIGMDN
ncbi:DsrE family protein [Algoriphagus sp. CAU 1675]|uniref:DsrE family protein n=1 Tax=Algoriphagus sp. CAU 1675 TaxID=3032597 RepID=UPI0023DA547A|nr:DsrE family protein [Algoriphagus sp. CAU 1675]MDF2156892.1 DsrE family protein [Algoriphagus sp. CAU 1675]